ncbi:hypothetical protein D3C83_61140 [compost metagenome]
MALIEATVRAPANDFRGALAQVDRLAADIGGVGGLRAEVVESPLDVRSSTALQGRHGAGGGAEMEMRFVLRVVRDGGAPA